MSTETPNLGGTPPESAGRDAVHVAVVPMTVGGLDERLNPGQRVRLADGCITHGENGECWNDAVGIVDPFRTEDVATGERFWLFLFPGTITGLRHVWTHPAFAPKAPAKEPTRD